MTPWMVGLGLLVSFTADAGTETAIGSSRLGVIDADTVPPLPPGTLLIGSALRRLGDEPPQAVFKTGAHVFPVVQRSGKGNPARPPAETLAAARTSLERIAGKPFPASFSDAGALLVGTGRRAPDAAERAALGDLAAVLPLVLG